MSKVTVTKVLFAFIVVLTFETTGVVFTWMFAEPETVPAQTPSLSTTETSE